MAGRGWKLCFAMVMAVVGVASIACAESPSTELKGHYRWHDEQGGMHYSDSLPPQAVKSGYDIVNAQGIVVKHVDRAKTPEELEAAKIEQAKVQKIKMQQEREKMTDQQMLVAYPNEEDLARAQREQLELLDRNLSSMHLSFQNQESSLVSMLDHVASLESDQQPVPEKTTQQIAQLRADIDRQRETLKRKEAERQEIESRFTAALAHYREVKEQAQRARKESSSLP